MTTTVEISDVVENINLLQKYDYIDIEDKKTHEYKGLFVSAKYAKECKDFLDSMQQSQKQATLEKFKPFLGKLKPEERFAGLEGKELLIEVAKAKCES